MLKGIILERESVEVLRMAEDGRDRRQSDRLGSSHKK